MARDKVERNVVALRRPRFLVHGPEVLAGPAANS